MIKSFTNLYFYYRGLGDNHKNASYHAKLELQLINEIKIKGMKNHVIEG